MAMATQAWERISSTVAPHLHHLQNPTPRSYALLGAASLGTLLLLRSVTSSSGPSGPKVILSPKDTVLPNLSDEELTTLPYPHHALPGARDVDSPYGTIRVYEWGPEDGDKMLLIHGISTPSIALADLAFRLVSKGCRVMLFDLFGRGFSAAPSPEHYKYDSALYTSQIMLCLSSSPISWNPRHSFTIIGYSLGGAIAADFASHFPNLVRGLILVAPGGLIRTKNISFGSKILYGNTLPEWMVRGLVARRLWTGPQGAKTVEPQPETIEHAETTTTQEVDDDTSSIVSDTRSDAHRDRKHKHKKRRDSDKHRHRAPSAPAPPAPEPTASEEPPTTNVVYMSSQVPLLRGYPQSTVSAVVDWQVQNHPGFIPAFISSIRHAPVHNQHDRWAILRENIERKKGPLRQVWIVLGETDPIIIKEELAEDAIGVLGEENVKILVVEGAGHEVAVERGEQITEVVERSLGRRSAMAPVSGGKKTRSIRSVMKSTKKRGWF